VDLDRHFGQYLKARREALGLSLGDVSRATKIKECHLELLEAARVEELPARVFVGGFVSAYARAVGADSEEALRRFNAYADRIPTKAAPPAAPPERKLLERVADDGPGSHGSAGRGAGRRPALVLVVLLVVIVATLTLSILLGRRARPSGGLSGLTPRYLRNSCCTSSLVAARTSRSANWASVRSTRR
jgi:cytoskeletal protein RodZ